MGNHSIIFVWNVSGDKRFRNHLPLFVKQLGELHHNDEKAVY